MVKDTHHHNNSHLPVLLEASIKFLAPKQGESYLDLTAGYGGHASEVLHKVDDVKKMTLVDRDINAIKSLKQTNLKDANIIHMDFAGACKKLVEDKQKFDMIMIDLGVSSPHLDNGERGFSFMTNAKLDMRMDESQALTADTIVNSYSEQDLAEILKGFGEEPKAKIIAKAIVENRPLHSTIELAGIVEKIYGRRGKKHPATRTFQALRIAVNQELQQLESVLLLIPRLLNIGGRAVIISFHSLEDRMVKRSFVEGSRNGYESIYRVLNKKPISGANEDVFNRRARSAKLRAVIKINN
ncbi:16S rRNA (cytosine(1402)-N(4))-methyltransferase RsmH [Candidatus Saccharibacteria bacterium]|nr:16S rRNA (cytosine(1402)-N(4))-methyltransferase RsmH [Candidatus Saccharibacteria bacterium]MCA9312981.1 16S rRNA (cytosine(1402)-N(4))-methyltransferase RsmH [Candidatus Saccharibacteria bacterium]